MIITKRNGKDNYMQMVQENSHFKVRNIIISEVKVNTNDLKCGYIETPKK